MAFSIDQFRSKGLADGGARPNLFQVQIQSAPVTFPSNNAEGGFSFSCKIKDSIGKLLALLTFLGVLQVYKSIFRQVTGFVDEYMAACH